MERWFEDLPSEKCIKSAQDGIPQRVWKVDATRPEVNKLAKVTESRVYRPIAFGRAFIWEMGDQSLSYTPC